MTELQGDVESFPTREHTPAPAGAGSRGGKGGKGRKRGGRDGRGPSRNPVVRTRRFSREVVSELRKVIYPNRTELVTYVSVVLVFVSAMVALVAGLDYGFTKAVLAVFG